MAGDLELDFERFEYVKTETFGGDVQYFRVGCHHRNVEDVKMLRTGAVIARLCLDCDEQLPAPGRIEW